MTLTTDQTLAVLVASRSRDGKRGSGSQVTGRLVIFAMLGVFAINLLLRIFYIRYQFVNGDEAVRALTALGVLRGEQLYVNLITDKPPGSTLFYAAVLSVFNHSMAAVHIAAILWNSMTAVALYLLGARLYSRKTGLWAALLFVYFSASYHTQDAMAANTELLMTLPYVLSCYCYLRGVSSKAGKDVPGGGLQLADAAPKSAAKVLPGRRPVSAAGTRTGLFKIAFCTPDRTAWAWLVGAGIFAGIAAAFKQVGLLLMVFFAVNEVVSAIARHRISALTRTRDDAVPQGDDIGPESGRDGPQSASHAMTILGRLSLIAFGAGLVGLALLAWLWSTGATPGFWRNAVQLGAFYIGSLPAGMWLKFLVSRSIGYVLLTAALWVLAALGIERAMRLFWLSIGSRKPRRGQDDTSTLAASSGAAADLSIALWCLVSLAGVFTSGRFYGHYFIPALPALAMLGARGVTRLSGGIASPSNRRAGALVALVLVLFGFNLFRFHHRTAILAYETITGRRTGWSKAWGMTRREEEAEEVATIIRSIGVGEGQPLYIWGYALDVYWRSWCIPASRYLTPYYITGGFYPEVPASPAGSGGTFWQEARRQFIDDLRRSRPQLILNVDEPIETLPYPEIVDFVHQNYRLDGTIGPDPAHQFIVYALKDTN